MSELSQSRQLVRQQLKEKGEENLELKDSLRAALDETSKLQLLLQVQRPLLSFCQRLKPPVSDSRVLIRYQTLTHSANVCAHATRLHILVEGVLMTGINGFSLLIAPMISIITKLSPDYFIMSIFPILMRSNQACSMLALAG